MNAKRSKTRKRPFGVTVLAILQTLSGIQFLILAIVFFLLAWIIVTIIGIIFLALAILSFHLARGYVNGYEWARRRGRKVAMFAILIAVISMILIPVRADAGAPNRDDTIQHNHTGVSQPEACEGVLQMIRRFTCLS